MTKTKLLLLTLCAIALTGCENASVNAQPQQHVVHQPQNNPDMRRIYFDGHYYIKYDTGGRISSVSITHDPDCPCREKGGNNASN